MAAASPGGKRATNHAKRITCRDCGRDVWLVLVDVVEGGVDVRRHIAVDMEVIRCVGYPGGEIVGLQRRVHAELCPTYQLAAAKAKLRHGGKK